jgi:hypothetical protein
VIVAQVVLEVQEKNNGRLSCRWQVLQFHAVSISDLVATLYRRYFYFYFLALVVKFH